MMTKNLNEALVKFSALNISVKKESVGQVGQQRYSYANLDDILDVVRPKLAELGVAIINRIQREADGKYLGVTSLVHSATGESISSEYPLDFSQGMQKFGSAFTYGKRYSLSAMLSLATEIDDDGDAAQAAALARPMPKATSTGGFSL